MVAITKKYLINGPNNVVRLSDGNKVLYIFGDYHIDPNYQTECIYNDKYDSLDIDKYLLLFMKTNKNIKYDIFHEFDEKYHYRLNNDKNQFYKRKYIDNINKLFSLNIKNKYTLFKFHYMDIRDNIFLFDIIENYIKNNLFLDYDFIGKDVIQKLNNLKIIIKVFLSSLKKNKYIIKILNKYNNINIKNKINNIYDLLFNKKFKFLLKKINKLIKFIKLNCYNEIANVNNINNDINIKIDNELSNNALIFLDLNVILTDLYFLRRFLDKKYIKNGILYTGAAHLCNISYILVKYFNYNITHFNYISDENININDYIKNLSNTDYINDLVNIFKKEIDDKIYQCTDLFNFPDNFT